MELGTDSAANSSTLAVVCAASLLAVGVTHAAAGGELEALAVAHVLGAGGIGLDLREGSGSD